jgi:hypothetical protein
MPSIADTERQVVIDRRPGHYVSFPDVCLTDDGRLLVVYRECDRHINPRRSRLLLRESRDLGATWSEARMLCATGSHCPRITRLSDGQIVIIDDGSRQMFWSTDQGRSFAAAPNNGLQKTMFDRVLELDGETLLTTSHDHRGRCPAPMAGQAPTEQMVFRSTNRGRSWEPWSLLSHDDCLMLCEASMARLPGAFGDASERPERILALLRENSGVYEPTYARWSTDHGATWSDPLDTPMIGHRPTLLPTRSGRLLVTYRNVGPDMGVAAWLGSVEDIGSHAVHGHAPDTSCLRQDARALHMDCGNDAANVYWTLRPLSDPRRAEADLEVELTPGMCHGNRLHIHMGCWWRITPGAIRPLLPGLRKSILPAPSSGRVRLRLEYRKGAIVLRVNNRKRRTVRLENLDVNARPILLGNARTQSRPQPQTCRWSLHFASLHIREASYGRNHAWTWDASQPGAELPDSSARRQILTLRDINGAWGGDMGYNGVIELPDGSFYCVYHTADGNAPDYVRGETTWVEGIRFSKTDFGKET